MRQYRNILAVAGLLGGVAVTGAVLAQPAPTEAPPPPPPAEAQGLPVDLLDGPGGPGRPGRGHGPAHGPRGPRGPMLDFAAIDANGDKVLSRDELLQRATARIATIDTSGDGAIDRVELIAVFPAPPDLALMDVFGPNPAELRADRILAFMGAAESGRFEVGALAERRVNALLARLDRDRDGAISEAEAAKPSHEGPRGGREHGRGPRG